MTLFSKGFRRLIAGSDGKGGAASMRIHVLAAMAAATGLLSFAGVANAVTLETTNFIAAPTNFNGFETLGSHSEYDGTVPHIEDGISVEYVPASGDAGIWTTYLTEGNYGWYNNGGSNGYTRITLVSLAEIDAIQFLLGSGYGESGYSFQYQLLNNGTEVATGVGGVVGDPLRYYGFSGGGFDEVRLQNVANAFGFNASGYDALAIDSIAVGAGGGGAIPEPATWTMMIVGFGAAGAMIRRRRLALA